MFFGPSPNTRGELACLLARYHDYYPSATPLEMSEARCRVLFHRSQHAGLAASLPNPSVANFLRSAGLSQDCPRRTRPVIVPSSQRNSIPSMHHGRPCFYYQVCQLYRFRWRQRFFTPASVQPGVRTGYDSRRRRHAISPYYRRSSAECLRHSSWAALRYYGVVGE